MGCTMVCVSNCYSWSALVRNDDLIVVRISREFIYNRTVKSPYLAIIRWAISTWGSAMITRCARNLHKVFLEALTADIYVHYVCDGALKGPRQTLSCLSNRFFLQCHALRNNEFTWPRAYIFKFLVIYILKMTTMKLREIKYILKKILNSSLLDTKCIILGSLKV